MTEEVNRTELEQNLKDYEEQRQEVETLLLDDPTNEEYRGIYDGLTEVIDLTKELLATAAAPTTSDKAQAIVAITTAPQVKVPSVLPPQVAQQIRSAQQRAALTGQAPPAWAIGARVQALYSDGQWYPGSIQAVSVGGKFIVAYDGYENVEEVGIEGVRLTGLNASASAEGYQGVAAPKRHRVVEDNKVEEMPKWLEINPTDDEKTKEKKRKLQKSYKSKQRFQQMDNIQKEKADSWKKFISGKGAKRKAGFMTGVKKDSIFKVSDTGKVGVTGSGKQMTATAKRQKHEFGNLTQDDAY